MNDLIRFVDCRPLVFGVVIQQQVRLPLVVVVLDVVLKLAFLGEEAEAGQKRPILRGQNISLIFSHTLYVFILQIVIELLLSCAARLPDTWNSRSGCTQVYRPIISSAYGPFRCKTAVILRFAARFWKFTAINLVVRATSLQTKLLFALRADEPKKSIAYSDAR